MSSLDELEALVDELERRLDADDWDGALPFAVTDEPLTGADLERGRRVMARLKAVEARLDAELGAVRSSLGDVARRRVAAATYQ